MCGNRNGRWLQTPLATRRWLAFGLATCASLPRPCGSKRRDDSRGWRSRAMIPFPTSPLASPCRARRISSYEWDGASWEFVDAAHRRLFQGTRTPMLPNMEGIAPGVATGKAAKSIPRPGPSWTASSTSPTTRRAVNEWRQNQAANIAQADRNWPTEQGNRPAPRRPQGRSTIRISEGATPQSASVLPGDHGTVTGAYLDTVDQNPSGRRHQIDLSAAT